MGRFFFHISISYFFSYADGVIYHFQLFMYCFAPSIFCDIAEFVFELIFCSEDEIEDIQKV